MWLKISTGLLDHYTLIVVLLSGGSKKSQDKDIRLAKKYWLELEEGDLNG